MRPSEREHTPKSAEIVKWLLGVAASRSLRAICATSTKLGDAQLRAAREQAVAKVINRHRNNEEDASKYKNERAVEGEIGISAERDLAVDAILPVATSTTSFRLAERRARDRGPR